MKDGTRSSGHRVIGGQLVGLGMTWDDWLCLWRFSSICWYKSPIHVGLAAIRGLPASPSSF